MNPARSNHDILTISVIEQTVFILQCFEKGMTPRQLEQTLENETSLSRAYFIFFRQMGWIKGATESGEWRLTEKGRATLAHLLGNERPT